MPRDTILDQIVNEIAVRIRSWQQERDELAQAAARIAELDEQIAGAQDELEKLYKRKPALRPAAPE